MAETIKVPAIGVSITANVDGDRQVVFQTAVDPAESDKNVNALLDRLLGFASRQKMIHDIVSMKKALKKAAEDIDVLELQLQHSKSNCQIAKAQLDIEILEWTKAKKKLFDDGYKVHAANPGRRSEYVPRGETAQRIDRLEQMIEENRRKQEKNEEGFTAEAENFETNISKRRAYIEELTAEIAAAEAKVAE